MMQHPLIRKLETFVEFSADDKLLLLDAADNEVVVEKNSDLIREGNNPAFVHLIVAGCACRYKHINNGKRQIFGYLLPGDFCDLHVSILHEMDHSIGAISRCSVVRIRASTIEELLRRPAIARAFWWTTLVDEAVLREWVVNIGARTAVGRIAHFFCELESRFDAVGLVTSGEFTFPLTQLDIGDTLGLSTVHVNRTLQQLRQDGLISLGKGVARLTDKQRLYEISGFDPKYLHRGNRNNLFRGPIAHFTAVA